MTQLIGHTALVTGSSRGIGCAVARELANCGANVVINYLENADAAFRVCEELQALGRDVVVIKADVADRQQVERLVEGALSRYGHIDILVNNAGITRDRTLQRISFKEWDRVINVNLTGVFNCTRAVVPHLLERGQGSIVNIASIIGQTGAFGQTNYSASKAGVIGFTKSCALELARYGITVNAICPGFIETDMLKAVPTHVRQSILDQIPLGRFGRSEEIARCVRFLVTEGTYVTGHCFNVNGGLFL